MTRTDKQIARLLQRQLLIEVITSMPVKNEKQKARFLSYADKKIRRIVVTYMSKFVRTEQKDFLAVEHIADDSTLSEVNNAVFQFGGMVSDVPMKHVPG